MVKAGATVLPVRDVASGLRALTQFGITSVLCEGGGETAGALLDAGCVDRVVMFIAPRIVGGRAAIPSVAGEGARTMQQALALSDVRLRRTGVDVIITGDVHGPRRSQSSRRARR